MSKKIQPKRPSKETLNEEQSQTTGKFFLAFAISLIFFTITGGLALDRVGEINDVKSSIETRQKESEERIAKNQEAEQNYETKLKSLGLESANENAEHFIELFFNWEGWGPYAQNMKQIGEEFPATKEDSRIDTLGINTASGNGPSSTYTIDRITTGEENGQVGYFITQTKSNIAINGSLSDQRTFWYILFDNDGENGLEVVEIMPLSNG